jgi:O-acetyl-ADP-ribose deacetylase (regulator of RNase III)
MKYILKVIQGDISRTPAEAIINPANVSLLAGSGLCGVIHKRAGLKLEEKCKSIGKQEIGNAIVTPAFELSSLKGIIHACGPRWLDGSRGEQELLALTHQNIITAALEYGFSSIAIPAISTGVYRFPVDVAAHVSINTCKHLLVDNNGLSVTFVMSEHDKFTIYESFL